MKRKYLAWFSLLVMVISSWWLTSQAALGLASDKAQLYQDVANNCGSIKIRLKQVRVNDSLTRVNYGQAYESLIKNVLTPANTRLVANRYDVSQLVAVSTSFDSGLQQFRSAYQTYKSQIDELIDFDCGAHPLEFYQRLEQVRVLRTDLQTRLGQINHQVDNYKDEVSRLVYGNGK